MATDEILQAILDELRYMRTEQREGFQTIVLALTGTNVRIEQSERSIVREIRITNESIRSMDTRVNERLIGIDEKLSGLDELVKRIADK